MRGNESGCGSPYRGVHSPRPFRNRDGRHAIPEDDHPQPQGDARLSEEAIIVKDKMSAEEREILDGFERGELRSAREELARRWTAPR